MRLPVAFSLTLACLPLSALPCAAEVPQVVTDIPPIYALVAQVMGDVGTPDLLLEKGADEHDFQLRPSQMRSISDADLVVWVGPELTPWLDRALGSGGTATLQLLKTPGTLVQEQVEGHDHGGHDESGQEEIGGPDPHAWLNPDNAGIWLDAIASALTELDPEHAETYRTNASRAQNDIARMDAEIKAQLAPILDRGFLTYHAAYGYFTQHYGLTGAEALAMGDATAPGAAGVAQVTAEARSGAFVCAFPEAQHAPGLLEQVVAGTDAKIGGALDPVGSALDIGPGTYDTLIRNLANTLHDCLAP